MVQKKRLAGKDYITCGIFSALYFVALLISSIMNITGYTALFYPAVASFFIGILFVVLNVKIQKRGAVAIFSIIPCLYFFTSGVIEGLIGAVGVFVFAGIAEAILWNHHDNVKRIMAAGVVYTMDLSIVGFSENFLATDAYCDNALAHGINEMVVDQMRYLYGMKPLWLVTIAVTALLTFCGILIGKRIMKKHLKKAGIL